MSAVDVLREDCFDVLDRMVPESVPLIIADPPYGGIVKEAWDKDWGVSDLLRLSKAFERVLVPGGTAYVWGGIGKPKNRVFLSWLACVETLANLTIWDVITWNKKRAYGKPDRLLFTREECAMLVKGERPRTFKVPYLEEKRGYDGFNKKYPAKSEYKRRTNIWTDVTELLKGKIHPCEKPSKLAEIMIETSSLPGELVLDPFAGSGSTGVAAAKLGRKCILIEKSNCPMRSFE